MSHYDDYVYQGGPFFGTRADTGLSAPTCFGSITYLSHYPDSEVALSLLHDVVAYVTQLMERRGYYVKELAEFRPVDGGLQGQNHLFGTQICIRLRQHPPFGPEPWRPFEDILDTMLHELAHMKHTPHNSAFMALWNTHRAELRDFANHHHRRLHSSYPDDDLALVSSSHGRHRHRPRGERSERRHHRRRRTERRITVPDPDAEMSCCGCAGERGVSPRSAGRRPERGRHDGPIETWHRGVQMAAAAEHESDYHWADGFGLQRNDRAWVPDLGYVDDGGQGAYPSGEYSTEYGFDSGDGLIAMADDMAECELHEVLRADVGVRLCRSVPVAGSGLYLESTSWVGNGRGFGLDYGYDLGYGPGQ